MKVKITGISCTFFTSFKEMKMKIRNIFVLFLGFASFYGCGSGESKQTHVLKFTAIPGRNTAYLKEKFTLFEKYLSGKLGITVQYIATQDYGASVDAFVNGDVHLAWFGGLTGVRARAKVPGARAIAQGKVDPKYRSYFIAHKDTGFQLKNEFPMEIATKKFTFGSDSSTSGRLMPQYFIQKFSGKSAVDFFGKPLNFSGSHEYTAQLVQAGTFEVGAIDYKTYEHLVDEKKLDPNVCYVIWKSPEFADYNWTAHPNLDKMFGNGFIEKLQRIMIEITDPKMLEAIDRKEGLISARNEEWDSLASLAKELGLIR